MKVKAMCVGVSEETWFKGTRDERKVKQLNLLDTDPETQVKDTFDYTPTEDERKMIDVEAMKFQTFILGVSHWTINNGRLKAQRGKIDLGTVPASARIATAAAPEAPAVAAPVRDNGKAVLQGVGTSGSPASAGK